MSGTRRLSQSHVPQGPQQQHNGANDPSQLTVFAPLPSEAESAVGQKSFLFKVLKKVTGTSTGSLSSASIPHSSYSQAEMHLGNNSTQNVNGALARQRHYPRSIDPHGKTEDEMREQTPSSGSFFSPESSFPSHSEAAVENVPGVAMARGSNKEEHPRNLGSVLERIKFIRSKGSQPYRDNDFKQYWMPDSSSKECYDCGEKFTAFRRRRHCRVCGQIFCTRCANQEMDGRLLGYSGTIRMCSFCSQVVLGVVRYSDDPSSMNNNPAQKQTATDDVPEYSARSLRYQPFSGQSESDKGTELSQPHRTHSNDFRSLPFEQLREIWLEMNHISDGLELKIHRHRFRAFPDCVSGVEIVDWLIKRSMAPNRKMAVRIGQGLLNFKFLDCLTGHDTIFADEYALYKPKTVTNELEDVGIVSSVEAIDNEEPTWLQEIQQLGEMKASHSDPSFDYSVSPDVRDLFIQEFGSELQKKFAKRTDSMVSLSSQVDTEHPLTVSIDPSETGSVNHTPPPLSPSTSYAPSVSIPEDVAFGKVAELEFWKVPESAEINFELTENEHVINALNSAFHHRIRTLLNELQTWEGLDNEWHEHILALATKVTENVSPSVHENGDEMDIRQYVHIKKIPGGKPNESRVIFGVVCTKHVAHRKMRQNFINPKILLYSSALEYQRVEQKFSSLEPIMQQEAEFLKNYVAKISEFQPDILLVERNVSRLAQNYLFQEGITLAANMKETVMRRIARCTSADKFSIIDGRFTKPRLGTCAKFDVKSVVLPDGHCKAYMTLDGCPKHLGCTVLLRGSDKDVLVKVKKILRFVIYCQYNWKLEKAFLLDEHAKPPEGGDLIRPACCELQDFRETARSFMSSVSPFVHNLMPYLEWGEQLKELIRNRYNLPPIVFWSKLLDGYKFPSVINDDTTAAGMPIISIKNGTKGPHPLLTMKFTTGVNDVSIQKALANFRAYGGRISTKPALQRQGSQHHDSFVENSDSTPNRTGPVDCFDIYRHQRLAILCSIHACEQENINASFCVMPWILLIEFYGRNDLTLGDYLETFCFREDAPCPNQQCHRNMKEHCRRFACGEAVITVTLKELGDGNSQSLKRLVTWTWCKICGDVGPVVPLSVNSSALSFAKYLDLRFHASAYVSAACVSCQHSLHREHIQFFAFGRTVAAFKLNAVKVREIASPPAVIAMDDYRSLPDRHELIEMVKVVAVKGHNVFATIIELLSIVQGGDTDERLQNLLATCRTEKQLFKDRLECLQVKLASPLLKFSGELQREEKEQQRDFIWDIMDTLTNLRREVTETAAKWSGLLAEMKKKHEKRGAMKSFQSAPELLREETSGLSIPPAITEESPPSRKFSIEVGDSEENEESQDSVQLDDMSPVHQELSGSGMHYSVTSVGFAGMSGERDHVDSGLSRTPQTVRKSVGYAINAIPVPFPPNEHYLAGDCEKVPVIVYDDEISSMIAYVLTSKDYADQMAELQRNTKKEPRQSRNVSGEPVSNNTPRQSTSSTDGQSKNSESATVSLPVESSAVTLSVDADVLASTSKPSNKALTKSAPVSDTKQNYIEMQFADFCAKFYCRVFFPEEFRQLRDLVFPYGEDRYIRSLARCVAWKASGGKSGSTFSKTADGRFVLKQMSRLEVQSFMDFAPHYFAYMKQAVKEKRPTVLAKVVGVYRIGFRNSQTGAVAKQDLLIMENLFYGRSVQQAYDLKGSLRNRLATTDGKADSGSAEMVLLDENFLKRACENPLYIRPHAKQFLRNALRTDTQFLASQYVMDYSLLVGVDEDNQEILVGIIDYVRTFTWDKRLEMVVKSAGILGGGTGVAKLPTIVSPEVYRSRFVEAMDGYFLSVPDQWFGLARYVPGI
ncbi:1-phosphatidylinositol 3-phosphate 5-kinase-like isoform X2 [Paramacrobiotus metropolitanus]|uniref:1-phosphatidylinositol 3-phosphate 5-kinase-like isoform X2 n=1 Tax=Paramacrobiotus metropolitanus TaxID=2943436 RepID=UPI002445F890|nr:1-phosphatidylinositol 3-phosphate 5-kinase-like isoform X2 [Paramacrobiotus metropolitanus]